MAGSETTPPGWYRQPDDPQTLRWWDGEAWTDDEMPVPPGFGGPSRKARPATDRSRPAALEDAGTTQAVPVVPPETARGAEHGARAKREADRAEAARLSQEARRRARREREAAAGADRGETTRIRIADEPSARPENLPATDVRRGLLDRPEELPQLGPTRRTQPPAAGPRPRPGPTKSGSRSAPRPGPTPRPSPARRPAPGPSPARPGPRRPADRPGARVAEGSSRVVARRPIPGSPLALRFGLRVLLLAVLVGIAYVGFVQLRDAEPDKARTLEETVSADDEDDGRPPISEAVITLGSLPSGWATQVYDPAIDDICEGRKPAAVLIPAETVSSSFNRGSIGPYLTNVIHRFDSEHEAQAFLDLVAETLDVCRVHEVDSTRIELEAIDFPRFGDQTFAVRVTGEAAAGELNGVISYLRVGDRVASVEALGVNGEDVPMEQIELLTQLVARRLD